MSLTSATIKSNTTTMQRKEVSAMQRLSFSVGTVLIGASLCAPLPAFAQSGLGSNQIAPNNVPHTGFIALLQSVIDWILGLVGTVAVLMLIWGGFSYLTSAGNSETTKKAKQTITYAIIGMIIIGISYALVNFVTNTISGL